MEPLRLTDTFKSTLELCGPDAHHDKQMCDICSHARTRMEQESELGAAFVKP